MSDDARLLDDAQRMLREQEHERARLADQIHDDPLQLMTSVQLRLAALSRRIDAPQVEAEIHALETTMEQAIAHLRALMLDLSEPASADY